MEDSLDLVGGTDHLDESPRNISGATSEVLTQHYSSRSLIEESNVVAADIGTEEECNSVKSNQSFEGGYSASGKSEIIEDVPKLTPVAPKKPVRFSDWDD